MTRRLLALAALLLAAVPAAPAGAVVGGRAASEPYPWMTTLFRDGDFICGASLIDATHVLTAAHCVTDDQGRALAVNRFTLDTGSTEAGSDPAATAQVPSALVVHPQWDVASFKNDVAVFTLPAPAKKGSPIALATAAERSAYEPGDRVRVIGFGTTSPAFGVDPLGLTAGGRLSEVDVPVVQDASCSSSYGDYDAAVQVCAGESGKDSCQGDSGGPLMAATARGRVQVGVVSYGFQCGFPDSPGVYAEVGEGSPLQGFVRQQAPGAGAAPARPAPGGTSPSPSPPPPPPGAAPAPPVSSPTPPTARRTPAVRLRSTRLAVERGRIPVRIACTAAATCRGTVRLLAGGRTVGRAGYRLAAGRKGTLRIRPSSRARRSSRLAVRVSVSGGSTAKKTLRLRR